MRRPPKYAMSKGRWQVRRQRDRIAEPRPPLVTGTAACLSEAVDAVMRRIGMAEQHWSAVLARDWLEVVGPAVARHTRPGRMLAGRLVVYVDNSVWLSELARVHRRRMLSNLQARFGKRIRSLALQLDPDGPSRYSP